MITKGKDGLVDASKLRGKEIAVFREFLQMEKARHQEDIIKINNTLRTLKD